MQIARLLIASNEFCYALYILSTVTECIECCAREECVASRNSFRVFLVGIVLLEVKEHTFFIDVGTIDALTRVDDDRRTAPKAFDSQSPVLICVRLIGRSHICRLNIQPSFLILDLLG